MELENEVNKVDEKKRTEADEYIIKLFKKRCPQLIDDDESEEDEEGNSEIGLNMNHLESVLSNKSTEEFDREEIFFGNIDFEETPELEYSSDEDELDDEDNDDTKSKVTKKDDDVFDVTKLNLLEFCKLSNPAIAGEKFVRTAFQDQFKKLFNSPYLSDVIFETIDEKTNETKLINAHKLILQTRSKYFKSLFESNMKETVVKDNKLHIKIDDMNYQTMFTLLQYLYTGVLTIKYETSLLILAAANKFQLTDVKDIIAQYYGEVIDSDIACSLYEEAYFHHAENLRSLCLDFIEKNPTEVVKSESFQKMTKDMVIGIIESDYLWISEYTLFEACIKWAKYQAEQTDQDYVDYMKEIVEYIRFPIMTVNELKEKIEKEYSHVVPAEYILEAYKVHANVPNVTPSIRTRKRTKPISYTWNTDKKPKSARLTNKNLTVSSTLKKSAPTTVTASMDFKTGIHYWTVYIEAAPSTSDIMVGVTNPHFSGNDRFLSHHSNGWGISCNGGKRCHNSVLTDYANMNIGRGDTIGVLLNLEKKTLEFFVNGNSMGIAFSNVSGPVTPAVTLYHQNERATLSPKARHPKY
mmetsp:Transcript_11976/g.17808  ORF Transcript_11976/g.17808 Transcript_11976/m.17808 type:complete len:580 (+) Transcript_11976:106-1845(+)